MIRITNYLAVALAFVAGLLFWPVGVHGALKLLRLAVKELLTW